MSKSKSLTKNLVVPLESNLKDEVKEILTELGLNQSQVVSALYKEIARTKRVPLSFDLNDSRNPNNEEQAAITDFLARRKQPGYKTYDIQEVLNEVAQQ
jgi:addiction module RelB/DinJ family antitoxin